LATDEVQNDAAVRKGGFPNAASQMIHNSYQAALPGPLNVTATTAVAAEHPIPAVQAFAAWDREDGMSGLGPALLAAMTLTSTKIMSAITIDCAAHLGAATFFEGIVLRSVAQFAPASSRPTTVSL
jgi:hypothetical protein